MLTVPSAKSTERRVAAASLLLVVLVAAAGCQLTIGTKDVAPAQAGSDEGLLQSFGLEGASLGYVLYNLDTGVELAGRNENELFIPASTAKLPTAVAALGILGPDYRFTTELKTTGSTVGEVLYGDLYLVGGGDPLLSIQRLHVLSGRLIEVGIKQVNGRFLYDDSMLPSSQSLNPNQPADAGYNAGVSALSLDFNQIRAAWRRGDDAIEGYLAPVAGPRALAPTLDDPGAGRPFVYAGDAEGEAWQVHGPRLDPDAEAGAVSLPVKQPAARTARMFRMVAAMNGIDLPAPKAGVAPPSAKIRADLQSPPLRDVVALGLEFSNNLVSELIGGVAARRLNADDVTPAGSSETLLDWMRAKLPDTDWQGYESRNHSGLSEIARVSPRQMVSVLRFAVPRSEPGVDLAALLPVSGWRGSFAGRHGGPEASTHVWAKTGTMHYAKGLAGVMYSDQGRRIAFAFYVTDFGRRQTYDADLDRQAPETQARAENWIDRAEALEEALVRKWLLAY